MMILTRLLGIALAAYLAVLGLLFVRQRELVFPRNPARADLARRRTAGCRRADPDRGRWRAPCRLAVLGPSVRQAGDPLFPRQCRPSRQPRPRARFRALTEDGTGLLAVSYRGYGGSTAGPAKPGCISMPPAPPMVRRSKRFGAAQLVGYGESLGTGVVLKLAAEAPLAAVVLEAPYLSTVAVAQASILTCRCLADARQLPLGCGDRARQGAAAGAAWRAGTGDPLRPGRGAVRPRQRPQAVPALPEGWTRGSAGPWLAARDPAVRCGGDDRGIVQAAESRTVE